MTGRAVIRFNWVMHNDNPQHGRVGYWVTVSRMTLEEATEHGEKSHSRVVMCIPETEQVGVEDG